MTGLWDWWLLPLSGSTSHSLAPAAYWHGRLMVLAWGMLVPLGALLARYFKVVPGQDWPVRLDHKFWWHAHRGLQWLGLLLASFGLLLVLPHSQSASALANGHAALGWGLMALAGLQLLSGLFRGSKGGPTDAVLRGDHYDMSTHRIWFERIHKSLGWLLIVLGLATLGLGLVLADAPRWMPALLLAWWLALLGLALRWQAQGRCIDTYQAIWGPQAHHPGNQRPPIGWGVSRPQKAPHGPS